LPAPSIISVACNETLVIFKVQGLASMNNSEGMKTMIHNCFDKGVVNVCIDLQLCEGIDSTFMGTLLLLHEETTEQNGSLYVVNMTDFIMEKLDELGVGQLINIEREREIPELKYTELPGSEDEQARMSLILKAHEKLIEKNSANAEKFESFIKALKGSFK
jgi:anti-sigma B factor antagonist